MRRFYELIGHEYFLTESSCFCSLFYLLLYFTLLIIGALYINITHFIAICFSICFLPSNYAYNDNHIEKLYTFRWLYFPFSFYLLNFLSHAGSTWYRRCLLSFGLLPSSCVLMLITQFLSRKSSETLDKVRQTLL